MSDLSTIVTQLRNLGLDVIKALDDQRSTIVSSCDAFFAPQREAGLPVPNFDELFGTMSARLGDDLTVMATSDVEHTNEVDADTELRTRREDMITKTRDGLGIARDSVVSLFGPDVARKVGLEGRFSVTGDTLYRQADRVLGNLGTVELPESRLPGFEADPEKFAARLGDDVKGLGKVLDELRSERRQAQLTMIARRRSVEKCRKTLLWVARTAESMCYLVDLPELAERLRPAVARASRSEPGEPRDDEPRPAPDPEPGEPQPEPNDEPEAELELDVQTETDPDPAD